MRVAIWSGQGNDFFHGVISQIQNVDVGRAQLDEIRIPCGVEGDPGAIRRPGEAADTKILALGALLARLRLLQSFRHVYAPKVAVVVFLADDFEIAKVLLAV